jgi:hypothetical protein
MAAMVSAVRIYTICDTRDCPAVAQPGRAFGCRCWLTEADQVKQPTGLTKIETEESQAQTSYASKLGANPARGIKCHEYALVVSKLKKLPIDQLN